MRRDVDGRDDGFGRHVGEERDLLLRSPRESGRRCGRARMSGWMPISRISFTECWVGLVFSSPAAAMYGTSVTWT